MIDNEAYAWLLKTVDQWAGTAGLSESDTTILKTVRGLITTAEATSSNGEPALNWGTGRVDPLTQEVYDNATTTD